MRMDMQAEEKDQIKNQNFAARAAKSARKPSRISAEKVAFGGSKGGKRNNGGSKRKSTGRFSKDTFSRK